MVPASGETVEVVTRGNKLERGGELCPMPAEVTRNAARRP
jgi:hypothetical protein